MNTHNPHASPEAPAPPGFPRLIDLSGVFRCEFPGVSGEIALPGTLDEAGLGFPDRNADSWHPDAGPNAALAGGDVILTRFTRRVCYEGPAVFSRRLRFRPPEGKRIFLEAERARSLSLRVNGRDVPDFAAPSLSTPRVFELTGLLSGDDLLELISDNSYPGWPREAIVYSSAATDETQTNWNGVLGYLRLRVEEPSFLSDLRVYPRGDALDVCAALCCAAPLLGALRVESPALAAPAEAPLDVPAGNTEIWLRGLPLAADVRRWDFGEGALYPLTARIPGGERAVRFGARDFSAKDGRLTLNGRAVFLRGEANCAVFPETGYPPMDVPAWRAVLETYRSYGVNCMRFHSHCPPEAAFAVADEMGMLMQPELSHWDPKTAFESDVSYAYYAAELRETLRFLANHPSFVMLSLGNELAAGEVGHRRMDALIDSARALDPTRLYARASNPHYGAKGCFPRDGFYAAQGFGELPLRATFADMKGSLNRDYPDAKRDYAPALAALRRQYAGPAFGFEVGQYEVLPDFSELALFRGVTRADNLSRVQERARALGLLPSWERRVAATGELSLLCYRQEVEAALRTEGLSGLSLLGLQDFPGQGTALVGMLNSHLLPKPYSFAQPERFAAFFRDALPLALLDKYAYESTETLRARVRVANYGKAPLRGALRWSLSGEGFSLGGACEPVTAPPGGLTDAGEIAAPLGGATRPARLTLRLSLDGAQNEYSVWVYPPCSPACPEGVYEARRLDGGALAALASGGRVYLSPPSEKEALPRSIKAQFSTDFWSVGTFPGQEGGMGQLIDAAHPIFRDFPTDFHTDMQWWAMASRRAVILPRPMDAIVAELDSYATLRPMAQLVEFRCGGGRVLLSSFGLQDMRQYPEARALQSAIYRYLASDEFAPAQEMSVPELRALVP